MSKKKKHKSPSPTIDQRIIHSLRAHFSCTDEELGLITAALKNLIPKEIASYIEDAAHGKVPLPKFGEMVIDMGDGTHQRISPTNHPTNLLYAYLNDKYGDFGMLYWSAIIASSPQSYLQTLNFLKQAPFFEDARISLKSRKAQVV